MFRRPLASPIATAALWVAGVKYFLVIFRPHGVTWTRSCGCFAVLQSIALGLTPRQALNTERRREQNNVSDS